jgi:hypothetical protein
MRELFRGKNTIGPELIDTRGCSVEKPREVTLTFNLKYYFAVSASWDFLKVSII